MANSSIPTLDRRRFAASVVGFAGALALPAVARAQQRFAGREIVATSFGGPGQEIAQKQVYDWLMATTGARGTQAPLLSAQAFARMRAEKEAPQVDMFLFSGGQEIPAKAEGLTQPIPAGPRMAEIPANLKDKDGHWATWGIIAQGILYRTDKIKEKPTSYNDFFIPDYAGHIAFPHITNGYGMDFLVMLARANGGGEKNIDPGFEAMKKIKKASIFRGPTDVQSLFAQGDIWIMPYDAASAVRTARMGLPIAFSAPKEGAPAFYLTACIAAKSKNADIAGVVIDRMLSPESQIPIATEVVWGPSNPKVELPPAVAATVARPEETVALDRETINANRAAWSDRWNREIAG
jgi:putative spermidine/putrescine transport system substrate-binding protein